MVMLTIPYIIKDVFDERRRITRLTQFINPKQISLLSLYQVKTHYGAMANSCCCDDHRTMLRRPSQQYALNPNRSTGCYALIKPSFCHMFRRFSVTMEPHCALKPAKHLFKNKGYYHHNANDRFGLKHG